MSDSTTTPAKVSVRSARPGFTPAQTFESLEAELRYYKEEYQRLKAIIALQKQKIKRVLASRS